MIFFKKTARLVLILLNFCYVNFVFASDSSINTHKLITDFIEIEKQTSAFEDDMKSVGANVKLECPSIIELRGNKSRSFGAFCFIENVNVRRSVMLCNDTMIGKLTIKAYGFSETEEELLEFTKTNCLGGG